MKFRCEKDQLVDALSAAGRAVTGKANQAVLSGVQLVARDEQLVVTGTDKELSIRIRTDAKVVDEGSAVIPARLLTDIVKSLPAGAVTIETDENEARISSGRSQFAVRTLDNNEFPRITFSEEYSASLAANEFAEALRQVVRAASTDDARPVITGVLLSTQDNALRLVATDSYRLAIRDVEGANILPADHQQVLVPSRTLGELLRLTGNAESLSVALDEREITFAAGDVQIASLLIEGKFPDYRPLIPKDYPNRLRIDRDVLLESVRRVKLMVRDSTTPVRLSLRADGVELRVVSQEVGQATEDVEAKYEGEEITVAFNPAYLIDGLESVAPGDVLIETLDALKPATLKDDENGSFLYLIMPVRVS